MSLLRNDLDMGAHMMVESHLLATSAKLEAELKACDTPATAQGAPCQAFDENWLQNWLHADKYVCCDDQGLAPRTYHHAQPVGHLALFEATQKKHQFQIESLVEQKL
jgi:hypothetical protein